MENTTLTEEQQKRRLWAEKWLENAKKSCPQKRQHVLEVAQGDQECLLVLAALFPQVNACLGGRLPQKEVFPHLDNWCNDPAFLGVTLREIVRWVATFGEELFTVEPRWAQQMYVFFGNCRRGHFQDMGVTPEIFGLALKDYAHCPDVTIKPSTFYLLDILYFFADEGLIETVGDFLAVAAMFKAWCLEVKALYGQKRKEGFPQEHYRLVLLDWWRTIHRSLPTEDLVTLTEGGRYVTWQERGFGPRETLDWIAAGFKADYAPAVKSWKELGFSPEEAKRWLDEGWPYNGSHKAKALVDKYGSLGYTPEEMIATQRLLGGFTGKKHAEHDYQVKAWE